MKKTTLAAVLAVLLLPAGAAGPAALRESRVPASVRRAAERPRVFLDTKYSPPPGKTLAVPAGGDLRKALDEARPGDIIALEAGATFGGPFTLPAKTGSDWIVIRTSAADTALPPPGTRVDPSQARLMPKLEASSGAVIRTAPGAHHYRFIGLEIRPARGVFLNNLVLLGAGETSIESLPDHFIFDRCYLHGDPQKGARRGIALNSRSTAVIDSWLADFKEVGADTQAIAGWNGAGPFKIVNNRLEGAGENVMFGGTPPTIVDLVPSDIEIRDNHLYKPLTWMAGDPSYAGTPWSVKNIFELKNARRVLVEHNLLENNWVMGQNGFGVLFTVRTELDAAPWAVVEDVIFSNNVVRHTACGVNILGIDDSSASGSGRARTIEISNNLFADVGAPGLGGPGTLFQILNGAAGLTIDHNTALHTGSIIAADMAPSTGLVFQNNIVEHNEYGVFGSSKGIGLPALDYYFPGFVFRRNVLIGTPSPRQYPADNIFPPSAAAVRFVDYAGGDYRLSGSSPHHRAAGDGTDPGADFSRLPGVRGAPVPEPSSVRRRGGHA
ncbi:MAG: hypothetical protein DMF51_08320 [Acidobacteria bacterium]|nr:MAG: hypothetical protein DMF51_08320 [Acidobacteriota bacterium]